MNYIFISDTYVAGTPVFAGDTFVLNQRSRVEHGYIQVGKPDLVNLKLGNRIVSYGEATDEQIVLAEKREAYLEKKFAEQDDKAEAEAKQPAKPKRNSKKPAQPQTDEEGAE